MTTNDTTERRAKRDLVFAVLGAAVVAWVVLDAIVSREVNVFGFIITALFGLTWLGQVAGEAILTLRYANLARKAKVRQDVLRRVNS